VELFYQVQSLECETILCSTMYNSIISKPY